VKLIIQIPCYNEEATLPEVVRDLPREIPGVDSIELLVVDDGSSDRTVEVARELGVDHIVRVRQNRGLAHAFRVGIRQCLEQGADIVVNTDGDNQYCGADVPKLVEPILAGRAELVVGERPIRDIEHFSPLKKLLQRLGSWLVRRLSQTDVADAPSGFRAFTRDALLRLNLLSNYSYTLESLIQAGRMRIPVANVRIRTNPKTRASRLMKNTASYVAYSLGTMLRVWLDYSAFRVFITTGIAFLLAGTALGIRFLYFLAHGQGSGHIQSLILLAVLVFIGLQLVLIGLLADRIGTNKLLVEHLGYDLRKWRYDGGPDREDEAGPG
jgi:glycosyltransferase involved in cell wall biosynthesis